MAGSAEPGDYGSRRPSWTGTDLLVVIGIFALLVVGFAPEVGRSPRHINRMADQIQLLEHYGSIQRYRQRFGHYPRGSGHEFVLDPWIRGVVEHTRPNFDRYFNPATRTIDPYYHELRQQDMESIWPDLESVTSLDTHYAGRAEAHKETMLGRGEAWMADDNEDVWAFHDGTINVLWSDGRVTALRYPEHLARCGHPLDGPPLPVGPDSPVPELQKLAR